MAASLRADREPHVARLSVTPIKGFALQHPEEVWLQRSGAVGDRDFLVVDDEGRLVSITKTGGWVDLTAHHDRDAGRLVIHDRADGVWDAAVVAGDPVDVDMFGLRDTPGHVVEGPWTAVLSERAGRDVRLVLLDRPGDGSDVHPVTFLGEATVGHLAEQAGLDAIDPRRFRMLLTVGGTPAHAEDDWAGRLVRIGGALVEVGGAVPRCAGTTRHPEQGDRDLPVVRMIRSYRGMQETELGPGVALGVYGSVVEPGPVRVGDALEFRT